MACNACALSFVSIMRSSVAPLAGTSSSVRRWKTSRIFAPEAPRMVATRPKHAGLIGDGEPKRNNFSVPLEPAHDNGGEHAGIDIAAAEVEAELAAAKLLGLRQQSGKGGGAGTFSDDLLRGEQGADGAFDGWLVHQHDAGDECFHDRQSELARCFHRDAIGQRLLGANHRFAAKGCLHRRARRRRDPDHGKARLERMRARWHCRRSSLRRQSGQRSCRGRGRPLGPPRRWSLGRR